jgi:tetratricopeptide (TPR) repeat protein
MTSRILAFAIILSGSGAAWAQDDVYERGKDKPHKSAITKESAKGVTLKDGTFIPAEKIEDIFYNIESNEVRINTYRPAFTAEKDALDPKNDAKRKGLLAEAVKKYQETAVSAKVKEAAAKRHAEYKAAALLARQASEEGGAAEPAIEALKKYKSKHPDSWQIGAALQLLGRLQLDAKDFDAATQTYADLAQANVPEDAKQDAQLQVIQVAARAGRSAEASKQLDDFIKLLPKDSRHIARARVVQAELMLTAKQTDEAIKLLRQVVKETSDRSLKAVAYNALGVSLYERDDYKGARWEFLWVDVEYNQNKQEHAKALYYLSHIFEKLGDAERSQECRELLLSDRAFAGSEWRSRAQKELKTP